MKTKYLIILVAMFVSTIAIAQERTLKAFYTGYDDESELYSFEDADGNYIEFNTVKSDFIKKFNLETPEFVDEAFLITYVVKSIGDEDDEDYSEELTIVKLQPTVLKRNEEPEYEEDEGF